MRLFEKSERIKAVIDTNIFVSGLIGSGAASRLIVYIRMGLFDVALSPDVFEEYKRVIRSVRGVSIVDANEFLDTVERIAVWVEPDVIPDICSDPSDNIFLACAEEAEADFLVTKNTKHFPKKFYKEVRIVRVGAFLRATGK